MQVRYAAISVWLHWLMVLLFIGVYATIELRVQFPKGSADRDLIKTAHYLLGLSIFILVWLRIMARLITATPDRENYGKYQVFASKAAFIGLYALMIVMPILGYLTVSGEGHTIHIFSWSLPVLIEPNKDLAHDFQEIHETIGTIGYFLIGLHTLAALAHHFIKKDDTLKRMLKFKD
ncbi:cytochrome b [Paraglaciecola sp.]|uniref:cytochrome b n=1 Tax=Paraglaciecola sp. TaxID=1920173 RepID=UPI0030F488C4